MEVSNLLANDRPRQRQGAEVHLSRDNMKQPTHTPSGQVYQQSTRNGGSLYQYEAPGLLPSAGVMNAQRAVDYNQQHMTRGTTPKKVAFELILDEDSKQRARIPLRVLINQHDTTDSIVSTVKNFYGIYEGRGVSFEDGQGNTMIAKYENFKNDMIVYVRVIPYDPYLHQHASSAPYRLDEAHHPKPTLGEPFQLHPVLHPGLDSSQVPSRPTSRLARKRSISPTRDRRSASSQKAGSRSGVRSRDTSAHGSYQDDAANTYSDSDNGHGSTTSSRKAKGEQITAEISLENIMQDGRRMRPKFDSSELPLFVPPQVPLTTSTSSISPQRRSIGQEGPSPFARPTQRPYQGQYQTLPSPQSLSYHEQVSAWQTPTSNGYGSNGTPQYNHRLRERSSTQSMSNMSQGRGGYTTNGILPTPDPTIASCISDEDVARQLIALGDASNFSHGRASASTADDAFSGIADVASSTGATSDSESQSDDENLPPYPKLIATKRQRPSYASDSESEAGDDEYRDSEAIIKSEFDEYDEMPKAKRARTASTTAPVKSRSAKASSVGKVSKAPPTRAATGMKKSRTASHSTTGAAPTQRKVSSASSTVAVQQLAADEEDLSTKPRCQRCRKSKKGCDRQRPCQRCKDAGIGIDGCVSEDEGNGRKGRYGRHMGVTIKKSIETVNTADEVDDFHTVGAILTGMATADSPDKSKKRKR